MPNLLDFRGEAKRLTASAQRSASAGEKRMLETQATFYETIAAQEDSRLHDEDRMRRSVKEVAIVDTGKMPGTRA